MLSRHHAIAAAGISPAEAAALAAPGSESVKRDPTWHDEDDVTSGPTWA
ncbi:hypothetical protein ACWGI8_05840 [Streptomyces sp. NPDC054841]